MGLFYLSINIKSDLNKIHSTLKSVMETNIFRSRQQASKNTMQKLLPQPLLLPCRTTVFFLVFCFFFGTLLRTVFTFPISARNVQKIISHLY